MWFLSFFAKAREPERCENSLNTTSSPEVRAIVEVAGEQDVKPADQPAAQPTVQPNESEGRHVEEESTSLEKSEDRENSLKTSLKNQQSENQSEDQSEEKSEDREEQSAEQFEDRENSSLSGSARPAGGPADGQPDGQPHEQPDEELAGPVVGPAADPAAEPGKDQAPPSIFLASDTPDVAFIPEVAEAVARGELRIGAEAVHVDRSAVALSVAGVTRSWGDWFRLQQADALVVSRSGYGLSAAAVGGVQAYDRNCVPLDPRAL